MVKKTFRCATIEPSIFVPTTHDPEARRNLLVSISAAAPSGANRGVLRSRIFRQESDPHAEFSAFAVAHDIAITKDAYADLVDDQDEDVMRLVVLIEQKVFYAYESHRTGELYYLAPESYLTKVFKRYRQTTGNLGATLQRRRVRLSELDKYVPEVDINGFDFGGVPGATYLERITVEGPYVAQNPDVQEAKENAQRYRAFSFRSQSNNEPLNVVIKEDGSITLDPFPGEGPALEIVQGLEHLIQLCSDLRRVNIR